ncbi:MAG: hypothetical protein ACQESC_01830 [Nanobdellota archaeon]
MFLANTKKGDNINFPQILIITLLVLGLIIMSSFFIQTKANVSDSMEGVACRGMITMEDVGGTLGPLAPTFDNSCATLTKNISLKGKNKSMIMREIADMVAYAWWMTNEGRTRNLWDGDHPLGEMNIDCMVVFHVHFIDADKSLFNGQEITEQELETFFKETKKEKNGDLTYKQYIQRQAEGGSYDFDNITLSESDEFTISLVSPEWSGFKSVAKALQGESDSFTSAIIVKPLDRIRETSCRFV